EIWSTTNLDSCAAAAMLRNYRDPVADVNTNTKWKHAFLSGEPYTIYSRGVQYLCQGGPPIAFMDPDGTVGWPDGPKRIGWSQGKFGETNRCYGPELGRDINADGLDGCPYRRDFTTNLPYIPSDGDTY